MFSNVYKNDPEKRAEHEAVRNTVGWYYFTHHIVELKGSGAKTFLDWLCANPIANLQPGRARYTTILREDGVIVDDIVVFFIEENKYWLSTLFIRNLLNWLESHNEGFDVEFSDITATMDMFAVQGPKSKDFVNAIAETSVDDQKFFSILDNEILGVPVKIARAGYTGEKLGYEIYMASENMKLIRDVLVSKGKSFDAVRLREFQIMVWTLPTEKGFIHMNDIYDQNPFEAGLERGIDISRDFIGKTALEKVKDEGITRKLVGFIVDDPNAHIHPRMYGNAGAAVMFSDEIVGRVTKFTYGYTCEKNIGYALVDITKVTIGDSVMINDCLATLTERIFI